MSIFDDVLQADSEFFVDADIIGGEEVVYRPRGGTPRRIFAIVRREVPSTIGDFPANTRQVQSQVVVVRNHETLGILASKIDTGGDKIDVARKHGGEAESRSIHQVISQDGGMLRLEVR